MKKLRRFLTIGTYPSNSDMARLQAVVWTVILVGIVMLPIGIAYLLRWLAS